jgi:biopolymer transport protein TolR
MRVQTLNSAPLAALFLILTVIPATIRVTSRGYPVKVAQSLSGDCGDGPLFVVEVLHGGALRLNSVDLKRSQLATLLYHIFKTRAERVVFIRADREVSFRQVAEVIDIASAQADYVAIITPSVRLGPPYCLIVPVTPEERDRHLDRSVR